MAAAAPPAGHGPPPGRRGLPRPGGYLEATYSNNLNLHLPPAPPQPAVFDPANGFGFPETVDFRSGSQPVVVRRRSGPPGLLILIVMLAAAAGGAKLGEVVTRTRRSRPWRRATGAAGFPDEEMIEKSPTRVLDAGAAITRQSGRGRLVVVKGPDRGETIAVGEAR